MRTLLAVHEWAWWLMAFGSAALTFTVCRPRMLWSILLAAICGFCEARILFYDNMPAEVPGPQPVPMPDPPCRRGRHPDAQPGHRRQ
jgi:hypothetical protein